MNCQINVRGIDNHQKIVTKIYRTTDIVANISSNLCGRATHIYEAYKVGNPGSMAVIKDLWVDVNCTKEGDTLRELLKYASDDKKASFSLFFFMGLSQLMVGKILCKISL